MFQLKFLPKYQPQFKEEDLARPFTRAEMDWIMKTPIKELPFESLKSAKRCWHYKEKGFSNREHKNSFMVLLENHYVIDRTDRVQEMASDPLLGLHRDQYFDQSCLYRHDEIRSNRWPVADSDVQTYSLDKTQTFRIITTSYYSIIDGNEYLLVAIDRMMNLTAKILGLGRKEKNHLFS